MSLFEEMNDINEHIRRVNLAAYFVIGWSFFIIFILPFTVKGLNTPVDKLSLSLGIVEMLILFVLSIGVTAKRYVLLWPILVILLIDTLGVSLILCISRPLAILFRLMAIGFVINGIRSANLLRDLSNFYKKSTNTSNYNSENKQKTFTYEQKGRSTLKWKIRSDFNSDIDYYSYILSVNINSSSEEISQAYRTAIKSNHPDKYAHLGDEFVKYANIKTSIINEAMEYFKKTKNFN